jgi:O-acetyl-ADP-ribose deacetylase
VNAGAVLQARVHHWAELVDAAPQRGQDPLDCIPQRLLGGEGDLGALDPPAALDVDAIVPIHHHLLHARVGEQFLQRAETDGLSQNQLAKAAPGGGLENRGILLDEVADDLGKGTQLAPGRRLRSTPLDETAPQLGGELVQVPAADAVVHAHLSDSVFLLAPSSLANVARIEVRQADITQLEIDAIANAANTQLRHGGGVAGAISRAGGPAVQAESDERAPIGLGEAVETTAGEMPCRWVIHAATMELGGPTSAEIIRSATASTLVKAEELGARSLALVAFGTGVGGFPLDEAARIEVEEVNRHLAGDSGLERVVFAVAGDSAEKAFRSAIS